MLTLPSTPELESRLEKEAAKRGLPASEYAVRLLDGLLQPDTVDDAAEQARLAAIDELMGAAVDTSFSSDELRRERDSDLALEEEQYVRRFKPEQAT